MSLVSSQLYTLTGAGTEIPAFNTASNIAEVFIVGTATAIGNYALAFTGTPIQGIKFVMRYSGALDITTNSNTFSIFGLPITQNVLNSQFTANIEYYNSVWNVTIIPNIIQFQLNNNNLTNISIGAAQIADYSITNIKLANNAVATTNILNQNVTAAKIANGTVGTTQLATGSVDSTILANNSVGTLAIIDGSITNAKLNPGANNSVKVTDGATTITDLAIGTNQILGRLSGDLQAISLTSLGTGLYEVINISFSFEEGENTTISTVYLPYACTIVNTIVTVTRQLSGTDNATIGIADANTFIATPIVTITIPLNSSNSFTVANSGINYTYNGAGSTGNITIFSNKITPGGKVLLSMVVQRT